MANRTSTRRRATGGAPVEGRLVDHHQHRPASGEFVEHLPQPGLAVDQRSIAQPLAVSVERDGVVAVLAQSKPRNTRYRRAPVSRPRNVRRLDRQCGVDDRQPCYERRKQQRGPAENGRASLCARGQTRVKIRATL
jgi:hypothetical protein